MKKQNKNVSYRVPGFFIGGCAEAKTNGRVGYATPAFHLSLHLDRVLPDADDKVLKEFSVALANEDIDAAWEWFKKHLPGCKKLVPSRRKKTFIREMIGMYDKGRIDYLP